MTEHVEETKVVQIRRMPESLHSLLRLCALKQKTSMEKLIIEVLQKGMEDHWENEDSRRRFNKHRPAGEEGE